MGVILCASCGAESEHSLCPECETYFERRIDEPEKETERTAATDVYPVPDNGEGPGQDPADGRRPGRDDS